MLCPDDRLFSGYRPLGPHTDLSQHAGNTEARIGIIVCDKYLQPLQLLYFLIMFCLTTQLKGQAHYELTSLPFFTFHGDRSAHHIHNVLRDRHTKPRSLNAAHSRGLFSGKRFKDMRLELRFHADSGVPDDKLVCAIAGRRRLQLSDPKTDHAAGLIELDSVAHDIQQYLRQSKLICNNVLIPDIHRIDQKIQLTGSDIRLYDRPDIMEQIRKVQRIL